MMLGARLRATGKRRAALASTLAAMFDEDRAGRILPFDTGAAAAYVGIVSAIRSLGQPISQVDAQIATMARQGGARLAPRNTTDFERCGVAPDNPRTRSASSERPSRGSGGKPGPERDPA